MVPYDFPRILAISPSFCWVSPSPNQSSLLLFPLLPADPCTLLFPSPLLPDSLTFYFPVSAVSPGYSLTSEDLELGTADEKEHTALWVWLPHLV